MSRSDLYRIAARALSRCFIASSEKPPRIILYPMIHTGLWDAAVGNSMGISMLTPTSPCIFMTSIWQANHNILRPGVRPMHRFRHPRLVPCAASKVAIFLRGDSHFSHLTVSPRTSEEHPLFFFGRRRPDCIGQAPSGCLLHTPRNPCDFLPAHFITKP